MFDAFQPSIESKFKRSYAAPTLHLSQLIGLAMGLVPEEFGLSRHVVGCNAVLAHIGGGATVAATAT